MPGERPGELRSLCKTVGLEPAPATLRGHWHLAGFYRLRAPHSTARVDWLRTTQSNGERASVTVNSCTIENECLWGWVRAKGMQQRGRSSRHAPR